MNERRKQRAHKKNHEPAAVADIQNPPVFQVIEKKDIARPGHQYILKGDGGPFHHGDGAEK